MKLPTHGVHWHRPVVVAVVAACTMLCAQLNAFAGASPSDQNPTLKLGAIGILAGYFLAYSINHSRKTQDVLVSFIPMLLGGGVGAAIVEAGACGGAGIVEVVVMCEIIV
jgi:hypothetical protein